MAPHRVHRPGDVAPETEIGRRILEEIKDLERADIPALKAKWKALLKRDPPPFARGVF
jgi:hypothetical protein